MVTKIILSTKLEIDGYEDQFRENRLECQRVKRGSKQKKKKLHLF